jgi:hypothetical protein
LSADETAGFGYRFKLRLSAVAWFVLATGFLLALPVMIDITWCVVAGVVLLAALLAILVAWIMRLLFRGQRQQRVATSYLKAWVGLTFLLSIMVAAPIYGIALITELRPLIVPQAELSNGKKTVIFQGMMHIGSESFYKGVVYDIENALSQGYVIYYEGVKPSTPEAGKWFSDTLAGGEDLSDNYQKMASLCGLTFQLNYFGLLQADMVAHPDRHVTADVSTADMMAEYERLLAADPKFAKEMAAKKAAASADKGSSDSISSLIGIVSGGTPEQQKLVGALCRGGMSYLLGRKSTPDPMDAVILDFRNRALAQRIEADPHDKIYITYGAEHLPGVLALLQAHDPAWEIKALKWTRTVETPQDLVGKL